VATAGHATLALNNGNPPARDSIQAVQLYYAYAEEQFAYACHGVPGASLAYYGLARTFVSPGTRYTHAAGKSAMLQRVALRISPQNTLAGNELGVLLAQHGHLDQAESLFKQCIETDATPEAWQNLAAVYAKKGDATASEKALAAGRKLAEREKSQQAFSGDAALAGETNQRESQQLVADSDTENRNEDQANDERQSFWKKLQLSQKLPNVFRR
jgi:tetratricopeptide (TPR) repeat protein